MKEKYRLGIKLHKFFVEQHTTELFFFYNRVDSGVEVLVENEDLEFHCVYHIPFQYFQKFQQNLKDKDLLDELHT